MSGRTSQSPLTQVWVSGPPTGVWPLSQTTVAVVPKGVVGLSDREYWTMPGAPRGSGSDVAQSTPSEL